MSDLLPIIKALAAQHDVPWELIAAVCQTESSMDPWAVRYEPSYKYLVGIQEKLTATERMQQMTSWGPMQVMGGVAREHGYHGWLTRLCDPAVGINYGILHLRRYFTKHGKWPDAIASYNAGAPRKNTDGTYWNQNYVDKVLRAWQEYEPGIPLKDTET